MSLEQSTSPLFSVLIVTYNSYGHIEPCLNSLCHVEGVMVAFEVIVVDNTSSDGTVEVIRQKFPKVRIIENNENRGYGAAINQAAAVAAGKFFVILNPDTEVEDDFLQSLSQFFHNTPAAAIVGCRPVSNAGVHHVSCWHDP